MTTMRSAVALCVLLAAGSAGAQYSAGGIKIGILTDMNGVYSAISGPGSQKAAEMAADDFMKANKDFAGKVTVIAVDHQNKADIASNKASEMYDRLDVDAIFDTVNSACALATAAVAGKKKKVFIDTGAGTSELTNEKCNKFTFHYAYDNYMLANGTGTTITKQGLKTWYMIYPNYEFGHKKQNIGLAIGLLFESDVAALGQDAFQGAIATVPWFWNLDKAATDWSAKFEKVAGKKPTFDQAAVYSAVTQYLEAVKRAKTDEGDKVVAQLEGHKFNDFFAHNGQIRKEDHRTILDVYQVQVKPKAEAKADGDYYKEINKTPAEQAFTPLSESKCKMAQ